MKKLLTALFFVLNGGFLLLAQNTTSTAAATPVVNDQEVRQATEALTAKYSLDADQAKQMYTIQLRKAKNLAQIAAFQQSDPALYLVKAQNVQKSTLASIRRILHTKVQVGLFQKTQSDLRILRNKTQKELVGKNATKAEIEAALLAIYAE